MHLGRLWYSTVPSLAAATVTVLNVSPVSWEPLLLCRPRAKGAAKISQNVKDKQPSGEKEGQVILTSAASLADDTTAFLSL